jgi:hypothetical protein
MNQCEYGAISSPPKPVHVRNEKGKGNRAQFIPSQSQRIFVADNLPVVKANAM